jgi:hypothetical protein
MANVMTPQQFFARIARLNSNQSIPSPLTLAAANANTFLVSTLPPIGSGESLTVLLLDTASGDSISTSVSSVDSAGNLWTVAIPSNTLTTGHHYLLRLRNTNGGAVAPYSTAEIDFDAM